MKYTKSNIILCLIFSFSSWASEITLQEKNVHFFPVNWPERINFESISGKLRIAEPHPKYILLQDRISPQLILAFDITSSSNDTLTIIPYNSNSAQPLLRKSAFFCLLK